MKNTLLYPANIIDYIRILIHLISLSTKKFMFVTLHLTSGVLDLIDGTIARAYNQSSILGKCLDLFIDRLSSIIILLKSPISNFIIFLLAIDIISHNLYFSLHLIKNMHHKKNTNLLLQLYHNTFILVPLCAMTEIYFVLLYLNNFYNLKIITSICSIFYIIKSIFHIIMFIEGLKGLATVEEDEKKE